MSFAIAIFFLTMLKIAQINADQLTFVTPLVADNRQRFLDQLKGFFNLDRDIARQYIAHRITDIALRFLYLYADDSVFNIRQRFIFHRNSVKRA